MLRCIIVAISLLGACDAGRTPAPDISDVSDSAEGEISVPGDADAGVASDADATLDADVGADADATPDADPDATSEVDAPPLSDAEVAPDAVADSDADATPDADAGADAEVAPDACAPQCAGKSCGSDGCGGFCGSCSGGKTCHDGQCIPPGVPCCAATDCCAARPDGGCSDAPTEACVCAFDPFCCNVEWDQTCADAAVNACATACECEAECDGKACGPDGCGGTCGACAAGEACTVDKCIDATTIPGNTCVAPFEVGALPAVLSGDTSGATNAFAFSNSVCPGQAFGRGGASSDHVWRLQVDSEVVVTATLSAAFDSVLYVAGDCANVDGSCVGARDVFADVETVTFKATPGVDRFIFVDGWSNLADVSGSYSLSVDVVCTPDCAGSVPGTTKACGDDGCGFTCGACSNGDLCSPSGTCTPGETQLGNTCANPFVVSGLPYSDAELTSNAASALDVPAGACGFDAAHGAVASDQIYRLDPPVTGWYPVTLLATFDAALYALTDCASPASSCTGGGLAPAGASVVTEIRAEAGVPTWLVVDGAANDAAAVGDYQIAIGEPCVPACGGKTCGQDGCGHDCGTCQPAEICTAGNCVLCVVDCAGAECGDDGCGGVCGTCAPGESCHEGDCVPPETVPGATCDNAIVADSLPFALSASTLKTSADLSSAGCAGTVLGAMGSASSDLVVAFTPPVDGVYAVQADADFDVQLYALADCGDPAGSCFAHDWTANTTSAQLNLSLLAGVTVFIIVDGYDDVEDESGTIGLTIAAPCLPTCEGAQCGADGCGGACGQCGPGTLCHEAACVPALEVPGNSCEAPYLINALPYETTGDTSLLSGVLGFGDGVCPGENTARGGGSSEAVYQLELTKSGVVTVHLDASFDSVLYVATDCGDIDGSCVAASDVYAAPEKLKFKAKAGTPYTVVVDGWSTSSNVSGAYSLSFEPLCTPKCFNKQCGSDGCGLSCGSCPGDDVCGFSGNCIDGGSIEGNSCAKPFKIFNAPYSKTANTSFAGNSFSVSGAGVCPGLGSAKGGASRDHAYLFFPPTTGVYTATLSAAFDSVLIVADTCDIGSSCIGGVDLLPGSPETVSFFGKKGQIYLIVVDGSGGLADISGAYTLSIGAPCVPACDGKSCGPDGCGLTCGSCSAGEVCVQGTGACEVCVPQCGGPDAPHECGPDGCGGQCGTCGMDTGCVGGQCKPLNSCLGECGNAGFAPGPGPPCHCDSFCFGFGDCCHDICEEGVCMSTFPTNCQ
ncbi:MAG: hypothetical protein R3F39_04080 [Myxococcota bacterium]